MDFAAENREKMMLTVKAILEKDWKIHGPYHELFRGGLTATTTTRSGEPQRKGSLGSPERSGGGEKRPEGGDSRRHGLLQLCGHGTGK